MNLQKFDTSIDGLELFIDTDGSVYTNQQGLARMCGVSNTTIMRWCKGSVSNRVKMAEIPTPGGLQGSALYTEELMYEALVKYNPKFLQKCAKAGLRVYLHGIAGYKYQVKPSLPELPKLVGSAGDIKDLALVAKMFQDNGDLQLAQLVKVTLGNQLLALNSPGQNHGQIELEGAVECAIRLGYHVPKNYESSLSKYVKHHCEHLVINQNNMYPKGNPKVEQAVTEYCLSEFLT